MITWLIGETDTIYHFYCIYRRSQTQAVEVFASKKAILTSLEDNSWRDLVIDFKNTIQCVEEHCILTKRKV